MQRVLIIVGLVLVLAGLAWPWLSKLPWGRLPGDILIRRDSFTIYIPIATSIVLSLVVTLVLSLFARR